VQVTGPVLTTTGAGGLDTVAGPTVQKYPALEVQVEAPANDEL
jgi:hypothetical protein